MHLSRLLALGPGVVRPGKLKLELMLTLLENDLICCLVLLPCVDLRLIRDFLFHLGVFVVLQCMTRVIKIENYHKSPSDFS